MALAGVVNVNASGVSEPVVIGTVAPLKVSELSAPKSEPLTVTSSPPEAGPAAGVSAEITGPAKVYRPMNVSQHVFAFAQLVPVSALVHSETTQTSVGCDGSCTAAE